MTQVKLTVKKRKKKAKVKTKTIYVMYIMMSFPNEIKSYLQINISYR